ncbi:MAG: BatD family protein, partial [Deltaproteobacteria bacterium]|nr:BatD family protein [Deltaproteobacteria bacterium]
MRALLAVVTIVALAGTAAAEEPRAVFRVEPQGEPYAGLPFQLLMALEGFEESPAPDLPKIVIPDATVTPMGATPNVTRSLQIMNGRRSETTRVSWTLRWRVEAHKTGQLRVPQTTVTQGSKTASAQGGAVSVQPVPVTDSMKISLELPNRPVFVGETVPVTLTFLFQSRPQQQTFTVPLLSSDAFTVSAPPVTSQQRALTLSAGAKDLTFPFEHDETPVNGVQFNRVTVKIFVAPRTVPPGGKVDIAPASVIAALPVGRADFFGNAPTRMFRASDVARTLVVKPLPETDRPPTFAGAVGDQFSIAVKTSRSVVQLGEPVELDVTIKSNQPLDSLSLGKLDVEGRLPKDKFTVSAEPPTGELSDEGKTKTFKVTAQVTGPATEVPALAFSYFDPTKEQYRTIRSEPIALSVKGGSFVGAGDVVSAAPAKPSAQAPAVTDAAPVTAQLALSSAGAVEDRPLGGALLWVLIGLLYAIPLALLGVRSWQIRTRDSREEAAEVRAARKRVEALLDRGASEPARDVAGPLGGALRDLARVLGRDVDDHGLIAKLETEAFAPESSGKPLSPDVRSDAAGLLRRWLGETRKPSPRRSAAVASLVLLAIGASATNAHAAAIDEGRAAYQEALGLTTDATARKAAFARAAVALGDAVRATPDRPELLADWGNAALGAGDVATA